MQKFCQEEGKLRYLKKRGVGGGTQLRAATGGAQQDDVVSHDTLSNGGGEVYYYSLEISSGTRMTQGKPAAFLNCTCAMGDL